MTYTCSHDHDHAHGHSHVASNLVGHHHAPARFHKAFFIGITLNTLFVVLEFLFGLRAHSLALTGDAVHNFGDVLGLAVAWLGYALAQRAATTRFTFGFGRMSIFATILNGLFLVVSSLWIMVEAWMRLMTPQSPATTVVAVVAALGIAVNTGTALALQHGQHDSNIKGAWLHMMGDAAISAAVLVAALLIHVTGWIWLDPALSFVMALLILYSSLPLLWEGARLAMDGVPQRIDTGAIRDFIEENPLVASVADLHVWAVSTTKTAMSAHVIIDEQADAKALVPELQQALRQRFGLTGITLQLEHSHHHC